MSMEAIQSPWCLRASWTYEVNKMTITTADGKPCEGLEQGPFEPIAVIGVAAMMPDAPEPRCVLAEHHRFTGKYS